MRVLWIEDDEESIWPIVERLKGEHHEVTVVSAAEDALLKLTNPEHGYQVLIVDLWLKRRELLLEEDAAEADELVFVDDVAHGLPPELRIPEAVPPEEVGIECIRLVRHVLTETTPIICYSARISPADLQGAAAKVRALGVTYVLAKKPDVADILSVLAAGGNVRL